MADSGEDSNSPQTTSSNDGNNKNKSKDAFHTELDKLRESMQREKTRIKPPAKKEFTPNVYNSLQPFFDTKTFERLLESPRIPKHAYASRWTASTLVDPWNAYKMDATVLPEIERTNTKSKPTPRRQKDDMKELRKEGSTRLPPWPVVDIRLEERRREWTFTDVPRLRKLLVEKYTLNADGKMKKDYQRTKQDFYRMELDKLDEVPGDLNRRNLRLAYHAYLKNTPGSRHALLDCLDKVHEKDKGQDKDKEKNKKAQEDDKSEREEAEPQPAESNNQQETEATA